MLIAKTTSISLLSLFGCLAADAQGLVINEVVSRNRASLVLDDDRSPDWIELHNAGTEPLDLSLHTIGDDEARAGSTLPDTTLQPADHFVVLASGQAGVASEYFEADFRISGDGETLWLRDAGGVVVDAVAVPELASDESYARLPDGSSDWGVTDLTTPGSSNAGNALRFSHPTGVYREDFLLEVEGITGDELYYTLDGSVPSPEASRYRAPLEIDSREGDPNVVSEVPTTAHQDQLSYRAWKSPGYSVPKVTVVRIASFRDGEPTSPIYTRSYFVGSDAADRYTVPVVSLVTDPSNLFDYDTGIYVTGANFESGNPEWTGNAFMRGRAWERPVHVDYFDAGGSTVLSQNAGLRVHGQKTRQDAQKSLRLYARSEYGHGTFEHAFFPERDFGSYERLLLRTSTGAWGYPTIITDALAREIVRDLDLEAQEYRPAVVYLNGEYWGLYTLMDRIDERFIAYQTGYDVDSVEIWDWPKEDDDYGELMYFVEENDLAIPENYQRVADEIDVDNFTDYTIVQQFFANEDWPANNNAFWRPSGGKWRWIFFDLDAGLGRVDYNSVERMMIDYPEDGSWSARWFFTSLFSNLLHNPSFRERYISRYRELLGTALSSTSTLNTLDRLIAEYGPEVAAHARRWGGPSDEAEWRREVDARLLRFLSLRPCAVAQQLAEFFDDPSLGEDCSQTRDVTQLTVGPNPASSHVFVRNSGAGGVYVESLRVMNAVGQVVFSRADLLLEPFEPYPLGVEGLTSGMYFVRARSGATDHQWPIVVVQP